jgi:hypothetical protein
MGEYHGGVSWVSITVEYHGGVSRWRIMVEYHMYCALVLVASFKQYRILNTSSKHTYPPWPPHMVVSELSARFVANKEFRTTMVDRGATSIPPPRAATFSTTMARSNFSFPPRCT